MAICKQRARPKQRVVLFLDNHLIETVRIEAIRERVRPRDIVEARLRESYTARPARSA